VLKKYVFFILLSQIKTITIGTFYFIISSFGRSGCEYLCMELVFFASWLWPFVLKLGRIVCTVTCATFAVTDVE
jgi:hypothetical protein